MTEHCLYNDLGTYSDEPDLSLKEVLQLLEIYKDSAERHLRLSEDDEAASCLFRVMSNTILYLTLFRDSLPVMEKLTKNINTLKLKHMCPPSAMQ